MIFPFRNAHGAAAVLASLLFSVTAQAQNELWVLNETPPSLGRIDLTSFAYQEVLSFEDVGYATDLEIQNDAAVVVLENRVVKVDLTSGQIVADTELLGAQEAALLEDGTVVVTRGGLDDAWQPLNLTSHLVWLDGDDLGLEGELLPTEGPTLPSQEVTVVDGKVYIAVNNGWAWGQEAGRLGCWDVEQDTYSEWDLGEGAENPVALHVLDGDLFTVNNGDWSSTSVTRASLGDLSSTTTVVLDGVSVGCNASAFVDTKLAVQISGENGLRLLDGPSMVWEEGAVLNADAPSAYSLITHPTYGWTCAGVTDYVTFGEIQIRTEEGAMVATVPVGVSPGSLAWRSSEVSNLEEVALPATTTAAGEWDGLGRETGNVIPGMPALRIVRKANGQVSKTIQISN
ncbi:MAG: hypothetical protein CMC99_03630 [Flavobacteriales bacterium]|nr:hypothetical protein [Flavobacteriales bacterium]